MPTFQDASSEAEASIVEIKDSITLVTTRRDLLRNSTIVFRFQGRSDFAKDIMNAFFATKTTSSDTIYRGLYVQLGSIFELFVRKSIEIIVDTHSNRAKIYNDLPEKIKNSNFYYTGRALATVREGISGRQINFEDIARKLATCVPGSKSFELNGDCFTLFTGNCTSSVVSNLMESVNVKGNFWEEMGKQNDLRNHLGSRATNETKYLTEKKLNDYIKTRNGIVHRGEHFKTVTEHDVGDYSDFFISLTKSISTFLNRQPF